MREMTRKHPAAVVPPAAQFRLGLRDGRWWWSDELYALLGFEVGEVVPTTELIAAHTVPADRHVWARVVEGRVEGPQDGSPPIRLVDFRGNVRTVVLLGCGGSDDGIVVSGHLVDVTELVGSLAAAEASEQISAAARSRGAIEQAKGVVAAVLACGPEDAFDLLRAASMRRNVPLRTLAVDIVVQASAGVPDQLRAWVEALLDEVQPACSGDVVVADGALRTPRREPAHTPSGRTGTGRLAS
jgi:hypothetical protein